jgi:hypothetical protein
VESDTHLEPFKVPKKALLVRLVVIEDFAPTDGSGGAREQPFETLHPPDGGAEHLKSWSVYDGRIHFATTRLDTKMDVYGLRSEMAIA